MKGGMKRLDLLHETVDELLGTADRQRRNVVNGLFGVQLGALAARMRQRVDHMRADSEQSELKHLEQAAGTGPDDDDLSRDRRSGDGRNLAQISHFH